MYDRILVPMDGSQHSLKTLETAINLVKKMGSNSKITVLHVNPSVRLYSDVGVNIDVDKVLAEEGKRIVEPAVQQLMEAGIACDSVCAKGDPAKEICAEVQRGNYDLTIMGSRGLGAFSEVVLGSVSHKVIQHASCPVLIVK